MMFSREGIRFEDAAKTVEHDLAVLHAHNPRLTDWYLAQVEYRQGLMYVEWGDIERGYPLVIKAVESPEWRVQGSGSDWWGLNSAVYAQSQSDRVADAEPQARRMIEIGKEWQKGDDLGNSYYPLASALMHARRYAQAEATLAQFDALPGVAAGLAKDREAHETPNEVRMVVALERGDAKSVLGLTEHLSAKEGVHDDEDAWLSRAAALCETRDYVGGLALFERWLPRLATDRYEASPKVAYWRARTGLCELKAGHVHKAIEASNLANKAIAIQPRVSPHYKAPVLELAASVKPYRR